MEPRSRYTWDEAAGRYRGPDGRYVSFQEIRRALDEALDRVERRVRSYGNRLQMREMSVPEWQAAMARDLKSLHLMSAALAKGGWAQMSASDYGKVGVRLREQYGYLERFAAQVAGGAALDGRFFRRMGMYAQSGRLTYDMVQRAVMRIRGYTEERSVLAAADHCGECVDVANQGWQPIGTLPLIGTRECLSHCRCHFEYR